MAHTTYDPLHTTLSEFNMGDDVQRIIGRLDLQGFVIGHELRDHLVNTIAARIAKKREAANDPRLELGNMEFAALTEDITTAKDALSLIGPFAGGPPAGAPPANGGNGGNGGITDTEFLAGIDTSDFPVNQLVKGAPSGAQYTWTGTEFVPLQNQFVDESFLFGRPTFGEAARGLGIPDFQGLGGAFIQRQYDPALTAFLGQQAVLDPSTVIDEDTGMPVDFDPNPFRNFVTRNLPGSGISRSALGSFSDLLGASRAGSTPQSLGLGSAFVNPATEVQAQLAANLGRSALRGSIGSLAANLLAPDASQLFNQFAMSGQAANQNAFLPFLNQRLGLGL